MNVDRVFLDEILRRDLSSFIARAFRAVSPSDQFHHNWHIDVIAHHLEEVDAGRIKRLIINIPPRNLKSICASVAFPAWLLGRDPRKRIICASYSNDLAAKLARDTRAVMESDWYGRLFPETRLDSTSQLDLRTTKNGMRYATSVGGTLTGMGGDVIIIDDPLKPQEALSDPLRQSVNEWYDGTLYSRLNNKADGAIILIMQRLHVDDLVAHVLEKEGWTLLNVPAIAYEPQTFDMGLRGIYTRQVGEVLDPVREPKEVLDVIRATLGTHHFNAQYQQYPSSIEGNIVHWDWFKFYDEEPERRPNGYYVQSWDTASKAGELNDYSVCTTWLVRGEECYLIDVLRERLEYPFLRKRVTQMACKYQAYKVLIEDKASGTQLIQDLRRDPSELPITKMLPEADKATRLSTQSAVIEAGKVWLPQDAPWLKDFKDEILAFPNARHDDQVDSVSQFLKWMQDRNRQGLKVREMRF